MKLYRLRVTDERMVAPDAEAMREKWLDAASTDGEAFVTIEELAEPEATLHLTQIDISALTQLVALMPLGRNETFIRLKQKLDGCVWQLAAQRTMLEKAQ